MELTIKNMVCDRCIMAVKAVLADVGLTVREVTLGRAVTDCEPTVKEMGELSVRLRKIGFELVGDKRSKTVEQIKTLIIRLLRDETVSSVKLSYMIAHNLDVDYKSVSRIFSEIEGRTIESYYLAQKIEMVKELLEYGELTVSEISYNMGYSSAAHLSRQFKQIAGCTPTEYKRKAQSERDPLDKV